MVSVMLIGPNNPHMRVFYELDTNEDVDSEHGKPCVPLKEGSRPKRNPIHISFDLRSATTFLYSYTLLRIVS